VESITLWLIFYFFKKIGANEGKKI